MPIKPQIKHIHHLPYFRERTEEIKYIIIHCSRSNPEKQLKNLHKLELSAHYIIGQNGEITEALEPEKVAYHAGISSWHGSQGKSLNGSSIGIELEAPDMGQSKKTYKPALRHSLCNLLIYLCYKYKVRPENILAHSDIAPQRKPDPGKGFPWKYLYQNGITPWYHLYCLHQETDEVKLLNIIGYNTEVLTAARYAFCRRWLPEEVKTERNIKYMLDNPYPKDFVPKDEKRYIKRLRAVAFALEKCRIQTPWYLTKK